MNTQMQKPDREYYIDPAETISTLASTASTLASIIDATAKTDNLYYVKLVISNFSQGGFYLSQYRKSDLNVIQPTIMKGTSVTYMCESKNFCSLSAQMRFWCAQDLYSTAWSERAFCVSINNSDSSRLLVYECAQHDSLEDVMSRKIGKEILNLTNDVTYKCFYNSFIYASVTDTKSKNIEINLHIGGNPFNF
ncbi:hypothetical protein Glove_23g80 [Diversispora epigaea]|uniref:Uncharacterized protein n=1 Tax=Diversispora epigaea TaxID=1348612 RepID=A0A397JIV1_9GLOM|nr:hypothetical protein Glove_23g80 [Diversispora epigaea]